MDLRDSKTQKIALAVVASLVVIYFWYSRVYTSYDEQITSKSREFETITTNLKNVEMKAKSLDALQVEYAQLIERYHQIEALLPEVKQIPSMLVQLHTASSLTGTKITKLDPLPASSEEFYNVASFEIELVGTYHDFGSFLSYVANFPFIANINNVDIKAKNVAISSSGNTSSNPETGETVEVGRKKETMTATFTLSTYYVKEEERLKELTL
jgi:type IV pilus assembly protein PilO